MSRRSTDWIIIHCSATPSHMDVDAKTIDRWHRAQGWLRIGYHYVIKRDGTIEPGRDLMSVGAHTVGANSNSVGICLIGGVDGSMQPENNFTQAQWAALQSLVKGLMTRFPDAKVKGHRFFDKGRACPSFDVDGWMVSMSAPINARVIPPNPEPLLRRGSKGFEVAQLQRLLKITDDGVFGLKTESAVKQFQTQQKLVADGIVGPHTWRALRLYLEKLNK